MLELTVEGELYDESENEFITVGPRIVRFEHSLLSVSKWESKWEKPFLDKRSRKTTEESIDYIRCMALDSITDAELGLVIATHIGDIQEYIDSKQTATTISSLEPTRPGRTAVWTSEVIYYYMFSCGIPADPCERWHLNRLLVLLEIFSIKNSPKKKMAKRDVSKMYRDLNASRRAKSGSKG